MFYYVFITNLTHNYAHFSYNDEWLNNSLFNGDSRDIQDHVI